MKITNPQNISGQPLLSQIVTSGANLSGAGTPASPLSVTGLVAATTTVNGKALSSNVTITALDIPMSAENGAATVAAKINELSETITSGGDVTVSPVTYAGNAVSSIVAGSNVSMTYSNGALTVNAAASSIMVDANISSNSTNPVQNKAVYSALASKAASSHQHSASDLTGIVPSTRTVNSKALSSNVTITALDIPVSAENNAATVAAKLQELQESITGGGDVTISPVTYAGNAVSSIVQGSNVSMAYSNGALTVNATATPITVDANISSNSSNPVQNKAVYSALSSMANATHSHSIAQVSGLADISARVSSLEDQMGNVAIALQQI